MKVQDLMTSDVRSCMPSRNLAEVAGILWDTDCGVVPITDHENKVLGMLTDRDICIALATRNHPASEIQAGEIIGQSPFTCRPEEELQAAIDVMKQHRIRRIPVCDQDGMLRGILSINDIILAAEKDPGARNSITYDETMDLLKIVSEHHEVRNPEKTLAASHTMD